MIIMVMIHVDIIITEQSLGTHAQINSFHCTDRKIVVVVEEFSVSDSLNVLIG